jgi:RNA polymerase sigma-70 factor (ECF subfamily)
MAREDCRVDKYASFYRAEFAAVTRTVHLIVHDRQRAEDIAQEAFLQVHRHWRKVSEYERPGAWVRRVAIRLAVKGVRRERLRGPLERVAAGRTTQVAPAVERARDLDLMQAVRSLPAQQRAVVVLHYYEDRPVAEIAALLGCTESAAKVWLHRARRRLAELLTEEVVDDVS